MQPPKPPEPAPRPSPNRRFGNFLDTDHPFFRPPWRRYLVVAVCCVWASIEWINGGGIWATLASCFALYSGWKLVIAYRPPNQEGD